MLDVECFLFPTEVCHERATPFRPWPHQDLHAWANARSKCCAASISTWRAANSSPCAARPAPAKARCSISSAGSTRRTRVKSISPARICRVFRSELTYFRNATASASFFKAYHLLPELNALENVCLPARMARTSISQAGARGRDLLARVGLKDRMEHKPFRAFRRRTAARGHRPRPHQRTGTAAGR
jgi:hypothetical protein